MRSSDRVLADIGVMRADIPLIAKGTDSHRRRPPAGPVRRLWRGMRSHLDAVAIRLLSPTHTCFEAMVA